jgi:hypothetical protein
VSVWNRFRRLPPWVFLTVVASGIALVDALWGVVGRAGPITSLIATSAILAVALGISIADSLTLRGPVLALYRDELQRNRRTLYDIGERLAKLSPAAFTLSLHDHCHIGKGNGEDCVEEDHELTATSQPGVLYVRVRASSDTAAAVKEGPLTFDSVGARAKIVSSTAPAGQSDPAYTVALVETSDGKRADLTGFALFRPAISPGHTVNWNFSYPLPGLWAELRKTSVRRDFYRVRLDKRYTRYAVTFIFDDADIRASDVTCSLSIPPEVPASVPRQCTPGLNGAHLTLDWSIDKPQPGVYEFTLERH